MKDKSKVRKHQYQLYLNDQEKAVLDEIFKIFDEMGIKTKAAHVFRKALDRFYYEARDYGKNTGNKKADFISIELGYEIRSISCINAELIGPVEVDGITCDKTSRVK